MKTIDVSTPTYHAATALVDDEDYPAIAGFKWRRDRAGYIVRSVRRNGVPGTEYMHRRIMGEPDGLVDHANGDPSDNRRCNLRLADRQANAANMKTQAACGLKGVTAHGGGLWRARIMVDGKQVCLGLHGTPEEAHVAYIAAAQGSFGEFATVRGSRQRKGDKVTPTR